MEESGVKEVRVFRPKSLGGTLRLYTRNPDSLLYAGGTEIIRRVQRGSRRVFAFPQKVIYLGNVQELNRISRSQRYLDIGSALDLSRILKLGRNVLPPVLFEPLSGIATPAVRNLATLGGNICVRSCRGDSLPALSVIDAQLELRTAGSTRWTTVGSFLNQRGRPELRPGEILTRIRVPLEEWDFALFRKVGGRQRLGRNTLSLAGVARFPKGRLEVLHFCLGGLKTPVLRLPGLESRLKNAAVPVSTKLIDSLLADLDAALEEEVDDSTEGRYRKATTARLFRWFMEKVNSRSLELL
jgi:CO/xanthine dehydrogenase FAD-binding subunit